MKAITRGYAKTCEGCGVAFPIGRQPDGSYIQGTYRRYCTKKCAAEHNRTQKSTRVDKTCEQCGTKFSVAAHRNDLARFCSRACKGLHRQVHQSKVCPSCGNEFAIAGRGHARKGSIYCSLKCVHAAQKKHRTCKRCGKQYYRTHHAQPTFCSRECHAEDARDRRVGIAPPTVRGRGVEPIDHVCEFCGNAFQNRIASSRFCSRICLYKGMTGPLGPSWKGGRSVNSHGYVLVYAPNFSKPGKNGVALEHRVVMENSLGRPLTESESVHHINGIRDDNRIENLQLRQGKHGRGTRMVCLDCGSHNVGHLPLP